MTKLHPRNYIGDSNVILREILLIDMTNFRKCQLINLSTEEKFQDFYLSQTINANFLLTAARNILLLEY